MRPRLRRTLSILAPLGWLAISGCGNGAEPGKVLDEARIAGRAADSFPAAGEDYFLDMDGGIALTPDEVKGRNTWMVWTGGNDRFWDGIARTSVGTLDLLKTLSSHPALKAGRDNRWHYLGLVNEPCFEKASGPDPSRFDLWLDRRRADCPPDPFEEESRYPGVRIGARGKNLPVGSYYGLASGVVGLRLFPNPEFDEAAAGKWDAKRYYEDPDYYLSKDLVKPYRVGMSCAFCHVGPNPVKPPVDPENPQWANLSSNVGAQYFWVDRILAWEADTSSFAFQLFHTSRPGSLDTSLVSTDNINNPRSMNAVYALGPRLEQAKRWGRETLGGGGENNRQFNDYVKEGPLTEFFQSPVTVWSPRVLKDAADSVGALGALNRVYLNIGLFSEEWLLHFNALVGGKPTTPIEIAAARRNSTYWGATEARTPSMALFFLRSTAPHKLADAPGGATYLSTDRKVLTRGKEVFADRCVRCHSSKLPEPAPGVDPGGCAGPMYLDCWWKYWAWTKTDEFKQRALEIVLAEDFLEGNLLASELRVPVTLLETNACSPLATNAIAGNIWDNFSSRTYKELPSAGTITVHHPITGEPRAYAMPAGGRGYTRPASLVSLWSTAPFLLNNSVGRFDPSPSVEARLRSFQDSIEKMLWPERRESDRDRPGGAEVGLESFQVRLDPEDPAAASVRLPGVIDRTTEQSFLRIPAGYLPEFLQPLVGTWSRWAPWLFGEGGIEIGPIPAGTPVGLIANIQLALDTGDKSERLRHDARLLALLVKAKRDFKDLPPDAGDEEARKVFADLVEPLLELSKCPDYVVNRGHYFGTSYLPDRSEPGLSDEDKLALIEFLRTF